MTRDLGGYQLPTGPNGESERHTKWIPGGYEWYNFALPKGCECPCRIAHPQRLEGDCSSNGPVIAAAIVGGVFAPTHTLDLCGTCAAAQASARLHTASVEREGFRAAVGSLGQFAIVVVLIGTPVGMYFGHRVAGVLLAVGVGLSAAYIDYERKRFLRAAGRW